jgi:hypothetical protein
MGIFRLTFRIHWRLLDYVNVSIVVDTSVLFAY